MLYLQPSYEKINQIITTCSLLYCDPRYIQNPIIIYILNGASGDKQQQQQKGGGR